MHYDNKQIETALRMLEQGIREEVLKDVRDDFLRDGNGTYLCMPITMGEVDASPLEVKLVLDEKAVKTFSVREELLNEFCSDIEENAGRIELTVSALRQLADELAALLPVTN